MILFDTSVLSRVFRRRRSGDEERELALTLADLLAGEHELGMAGIVLQEVLSGVRSPRQFLALERQLRASFTILVPGVEEHVQAARLRNKCLHHGLSVSGIDCLIAVVAIAGDHWLFTRDKDFIQMAKHSPLLLFEPN